MSLVSWQEIGVRDCARWQLSPASLRVKINQPSHMFAAMPGAQEQAERVAGVLEICPPLVPGLLQ